MPKKKKSVKGKNKPMFYTIGDRFLMQGVEVEVAIVSRDNRRAWVVPTENFIDSKGRQQYTCCVMGSLDEKGLDSEGKKAHYIMPEGTSGAV